HQKRAVKYDLPGQVLPDEDEPRTGRLDDAQRDKPERVIEKMRRDVEEEDVARPETEASDHRATSAAATPLRADGRWQLSSRQRRSAAATGWGARRSPLRCRPW